MKRSKVLALLMAVIMIAAVFAACGISAAAENGASEAVFYRRTDRCDRDYAVCRCQNLAQRCPSRLLDGQSGRLFYAQYSRFS